METVRRGLDHFNETGDLLRELIDPQVELVIDPFANLAGTYVGHEGLRDYFSKATDMGQVIRVEIDELIDAGDSVVVLGHFRAQVQVSDIAGSDMTVEQVMGWLYRLRDGQIVRIRAYLRQSEALEAVGLGD